MKSNVIASAIFGMIVVASVSFAHAQSSVFDDLQPQPKKVVASGGVCEDVTNVRFVRKTIDGVRSDLLPEAYELLIAGDGVTVYASGEKGKRYAQATLGQLVKLSGGRVPCGTVTDWPQYRWRGLMHDCGRNYLDVPSLCKVLDLMAAYKLNLFHWHITDYYGWRLESKKYPALQAPWAFRRQMSRYYTQKEFRDVLDYAKERGITVMPELDVPGHTLAFRKGLNMKEGDEIIVQVTKLSRGNKGAKVTTHLSFVGKRIIFLPNTNFLGISRKIEDEKTREILLKTADKLRENTQAEGFIMRTQAPFATQKQLKTEAD